MPICQSINIASYIYRSSIPLLNTSGPSLQSLNPFICPSLSVSQFIFPSLLHLSIYMPGYHNGYLYLTFINTFIKFNTCGSTLQSLNPFICPSLSVYLYIFVSPLFYIYMPIYLFIDLSIRGSKNESRVPGTPQLVLLSP